MLCPKQNGAGNNKNSNNNNNNNRKRKLAPFLEPAFLDALLTVPPTATTSSQKTNKKKKAPKKRLPPQQQSQLTLTNGAAQAMHDCQGEFVTHLTRQLKKASSQKGDGDDDDDNDDGDDEDAERGEATQEQKRLVHVMPRHVEQAMRAMGLQDILEEAQQILLDRKQRGKNDKNGNGVNAGNSTRSTPAEAKQRVKKKNKQFLRGKITPEMEAEQERLFQASLQKSIDANKK